MQQKFIVKDINGKTFPVVTINSMSIRHISDSYFEVVYLVYSKQEGFGSLIVLKRDDHIGCCQYKIMEYFPLWRMNKLIKK